jgi:hypothetical protein
LSNENYTDVALAKTINGYGFNAVQLWRSSLKPLTILESKVGEEPHEVPGGFGNMFDEIVLTEIISIPALEFGQKQESAGGFKVGLNLLDKLLGTIGGKLGVGASAQGAKEFQFEFKDTMVEETSVDLLVKACGKAKPNKDVLDRLISEQLQRFVVIRSLKAGSIICSALNKKGGKIGLDLNLGNIPASGDIQAELTKNGGVVLKSPDGQALIFGVDFYKINYSENKVKIGSHLNTTGSIKMMTAGDLKRKPGARYRRVVNLDLGDRVEPITGYINIAPK